MLDKVFDSVHFQILSKAMDASMLRNEVIANNMANETTPGFKRTEVIFEEKLRKVLEKQTNYDKLITSHSQKWLSEGDNGILSNLEPELIKVQNTSYRNDGNNVDIDVEVAKMAKNKLYYDAMGQSLSNEIRLLRMAITGRS